MARGFVTGAVWGVIIVGAGLVALSQFAPPPDRGTPPGPVAAADQVAADNAAADKAAADKAAEMAADAQAAADKAAADKVAADKAAAEKAAQEKLAEDKAAQDKAAADKAAEDQTAKDKAAGDQPAADQSIADKAAAETAATDKVAADEAAAGKAAIDMAAAEKAVADKIAASQAADKAAADKIAADKAATDLAATDLVAAEKVAADKAAADKAAEDKAAADQSAAEKLAGTPPVVAADAPVTVAATALVPLPDVPAAPEPAPSLTSLDQALTLPAAEQAPLTTDTAPIKPEGPKDALLLPGQPAGQTEPSRLPQIAPVVDPEVVGNLPGAVEEPAPDAAPKSSPAVTLENEQPTLPAAKPLENKLPNTVIDKTVPGIKTDGLPQVGVTSAAEAPVAEADLPPVQRFARNFDGANGKPLFAILLHDVGSAGMDRAELAKLPFPVSFVIDPLATDAKAANEVYRAAGQEVVTLANGIPPGATAEDLETTFQTLSSILPESVAVIDEDIGGFQDQRPLAGLVLPVIKGEGRGLVTYDRGLNAADQIAQREGVPAAVIFRRLDGDGESKQTIRRYLDRAAFKAAQEGQVVVIGDTRADTVAAILEWTVEGRSATVTLAPVTAVMARE
ncbi:MAG: divergent polysaccharide deacetylase family protein [bacterium]